MKILLLFLLAIPVSAQERFNDRQTVILFSAETLIRTLDAQSTLSLLNNPCRCYRENGTGFHNAGAEYSYSLGVVAAEYGAAYLLHRMHHNRLARIIPAADIAYDGSAVWGNWHIAKPPSKISP